MKRRILLVDDEVAVLLTLKAVLEISGFDVDTAASAREGKLKLRSHEYCMVISDMRLESERAGEQILEAARNAPHRPAIALLSAYPLAEEDWQELGADRMLVKPMHTRLLLKQIDDLLAAHDRDLTRHLAGGDQKLAIVASRPGVERDEARKPARETARKLSLVASNAAARKKSAGKAANGVGAGKPAVKPAPKKARRS